MKKLMMTVGYHTAVGRRGAVAMMCACVCALGLFVGNSASAGSLPPEYQEVEYVESTGSQFIDTGIVINENHELQFKYAMLAIDAYKGPFGTYQSENHNATRVMANSGSATALLVNFMTKAGGGGTVFNGVTTKAGDVVEGYMNYNQARFNDVEQNLNHTTFGTADPSTLKLLGRTNYSTSIRLYYFRILENGELKHDYVPCYLRSDATQVGFYDTVGTQFCSVSGLRKGEDIYRNCVVVSGDPQDYAAAESPVYGVVETTPGEAVELTAPEKVDVSDGVRAYCTGWKLYDIAGETLLDESDAESRLTCSFEYSEPVRLVWQWNVQYRVTVTAAPGLTVAPATAWGNAATPAEFTVSGTDCPYWTGDGIVGSQHGATVSVCPTTATTVSVRGGTLLSVPAEVDTLEYALAVANEGDTVLLAAGVYTNATYDGIAVPAGVMLKGAGATPSDTVVMAHSESAADATPASLVSVTGSVENITFAGARCNGQTSTPRMLVATGGALVTNCVFAGCTATANAGFAALITGEGTRVADTTFSNFTFTAGSAWTSGPCVQIAGNAVVSDSTFDSLRWRVNTADAPVCLLSGARLLRSTVRNCRAETREYYSGRAGGLYVGGANCIVEDCVIEGNELAGESTAWRQGAGGLSVTAVSTIRRTVIRNNKCGNSYDGGVYCTAAATFENCLIADNTVTAPPNDAASCGGIYINKEGAVLRHVTVVGNELLTVGSSVKAHGAYLVGVQADNCIFWGNGPASTAASSMNLAVAGAKGCVRHSLVSSAAEWLNASNAKSGTGCVTGNPLFTDADAGDYTLSSLSPAVDSGDPEAGAADDLRGIARPKNFGFDMGCYECEYAAVYECSIAPILQYVGVKGGTVRFVGSASMAKSVERMVWTVTAESGDAPAGGEGLTCDIAFPAGANTYTVSLTTYWNDGHEATATESATVRVTGGIALRPGDDLVATLGLMQGIPPDNPVALMLAEGLYTAENSGVTTDDGWMFVIPSGVVLQGAGEGKTVLDGGASRRVIRVLAGGTAADLTVTNALSNGMSSSGYFADVPGGTLRNVTIDGCCARCSTQSGQHAVYLSLGGLMTGCTIRDIWNTPPNAYQVYGGILTVVGGTVTNTTVVGNKTPDLDYSIVMLSGASALMTDCLVCNNTALNKEYRNSAAGGVVLKSGAVLRNSRIVGNTCAGSYGNYYAGGVDNSGSTVESCVITGNVAGCGNGTLASGLLLRGGGTVRNCLIAENTMTGVSATAAVGVYLANGTLLNCTVIGNTLMNSAMPQAGLVLVGGTVRNVIIWDNVGITNGVTEVANTAAVTNGSKTVVCTCTTPLIDGEGNIDEDPRLSVRKERFGQIKSSSPCVDKGDPAGWTEDDVDLLGNPRLRKNKIDMGCYQAALQGLMLMLK